MSKTKKVILIIAGILLFLAIAAWILVPRILVLIGVKSIDMIEEIPVSTISAETIANADMGETQRIEADGISLEIPADLKREKHDLDALVYRSPVENEDETPEHSILVIGASDMHEVSFTQSEAIETPMLVKLEQKKVLKGFEAMGMPVPDSAYNTFKMAYTLTEDDYSFWNLNQGMAYFAGNALQEVVMLYDRVELFETEDLCGFINYSDEKTQYILQIYSKDDLNTVYDVVVRSQNPDLVYAVLDSVEIEK